MIATDENIKEMKSIISFESSFLRFKLKFSSKLVIDHALLVLGILIKTFPRVIAEEILEYSLEDDPIQHNYNKAMNDLKLSQIEKSKLDFYSSTFIRNLIPFIKKCFHFK